LNGDLTLLFIGGVIGISGSIVGYFLNHFLKLREQRILREFEIREKGREFFHQIYGFVAILGDLATSFLREEKPEKTMVLIENGYVIKPKSEIIERYKTEYRKYAKLWYESRGKGLEVFLTKEFARDLANFWAYAGYFFEKGNWDEDKQLLIEFRRITQKISDTIDKLLGISEKKSFIPKWLNPKYLNSNNM